MQRGDARTSPRAIAAQLRWGARLADRQARGRTKGWRKRTVLTLPRLLDEPSSLLQRFEIREDRFDAVADLAALAAEARAVVVDLVEALLQRVALAAQLLNRGDGALDLLTQPLQDLVVSLCRFFHSSFTGSMSARRAASCCWWALTSSCVRERSKAWYHMPSVVLMVSSPSGTKRSRRPTSCRNGTSNERMVSTMRSYARSRSCVSARIIGTPG